MRNLTVTRRKAFAACLVKVKIYIEDENGDTEMDGVKCRLLGKLKNNKSKTFQIGTGRLKIFALYDKLSRGYCCDTYIIPEGEEDVSVSGVSKLNPFAGNPFYFDGVTDTEMLEKRESRKRTGLYVFIACVAVGAVIGLAVGFTLPILLM